MMTALLSVGAWATEITIYEGSHLVGYGSPGGEPLQLPAAKLSSAKVGYCLIITFTTDETQGATVALKDNGWGFGDMIVEEWHPQGDVSATFVLNETAISAISGTTGGLYVAITGGNAYTVSKVVLSDKVPLFSGSREINGYGAELSSAFFAYAKENDMIVINGTNLEDWGSYGINIQNDNGGTPIKYVDDQRINSSQNETVETGILLTAAMVAQAKSGGLVINGSHWTLNSATLVYAPSSVAIGEAGYATFGYDAPLDLSGLGEGQDAYTVTVSGDKAQLTSVKGKKIPANMGIILKGSNGDAISLPLTTETTDEITGNELLVSDGTVTGNGSTIYVLAEKNGVVGFYLVDDGSAIPAGKAYLQVSNSGAARQFIGFGDDTNGINNIERAASDMEQYYDLQGRRVAQPAKGLYIVNGKKVIIK